MIKTNEIYAKTSTIKITEAGLVVDWIRLFARLIGPKLCDVFLAVTIRALLELVTNLKKPIHLF